MLVFKPTPDDNCPLQPISLPVGQLSGVFCMLRGKLKPPLSRSLYRLQTFWIDRFPVPLLPSLARTAWVQLAKPLQYPVPARAASKNGWGATAAVLPMQFPPPMFFGSPLPQYPITALA